MKSIPAVRALVLLCAVLFVRAGVAEQIVLKNTDVAATFDGRGLVFVKQTAGKQIELARDGWTITIDGKHWSSEDATPAVEPSGNDAVTYRYRLDGFEVEALYKLMRGSRFVSKQLRIVKAPGERYTVQQVTPWDVRIKEKVNSEYTPSTYAPQFGATIEQSRERLAGRDYGAFVRMEGGRGALFTVQNPFLKVTWSGEALRIGYAPEMEWHTKWGVFTADTACLGTYALSGQRLPREMVTEWHLPPAAMPEDGMDRAEIDAFTECVRAFLLHPAQEPTSVEVGWTLNDYQIDAGTAEGRAEYKRVIDATSELGIRTLLYAPGNSQLAAHNASVDTWGWEYVLWLGLGEKIRKGEWSPEKDTVPPSLAEMLDYAKQKHVGLLAYVYPSIPFAAQAGWLVRRDGDRETVPEGGAPVYATLASREFQDYLIRNLIAFEKRTGIAGYSFDYTWLDLPGSSSYAQWYGWRRVMRALREAGPQIVIDGRQSYQLYGPWSWLEGSYPHPTGNDEQAESFKPFPDLHFDRVSADRARFVNYWYRNYMFAPSEVIPGYATHQTERSRNVAARDGQPAGVEMMYTRYRPRDWDLLGYQYSFLSSIATGGWNNVVNMIPARDEEELRHFSQADRAWIRKWLAWTVDHREALRHTRTILDQPALGHVDGTAAIEGDRGFLFLFNPNYKQMPARLKLDEGIGLTSGAQYILRELYPRTGRLVGKPGAGMWRRGDTVELKLDGTSATVLEIVPAKTTTSAMVFNAAGARVRLDGTRLELDGVAGEPGTAECVGVLLAQGRRVAHVAVNHTNVPFTQTGNYVEVHSSFAGERFGQAQQVTLEATSEGAWAGTFTVPQRIFEQMELRKREWPIPWTEDDYESTWLAPERLLLFVQLAEGKDSVQITARLDGEPLALTAAYSSSRTHGPSFVGFYADLSHVAPERRHRIELRAPGLAKDMLQGVFFDNVVPQMTGKIARTQN